MLGTCRVAVSAGYAQEIVSAGYALGIVSIEWHDMKIAGVRDDQWVRAGNT